MRRAAELRLGGLSLRQIGTQLGVDKRTIQRDLERWEAAEIDRLLGHIGGAYDGDDGHMPQSNAPDSTDRRMQ